MKNTGVFATDEEATELHALANEARNTPVILLFGKHDLSGDAWKKAMRAVNECALKHELPKIEGYYGLTPEGEFVTMD